MNPLEQGVDHSYGQNRITEDYSFGGLGNIIDNSEVTTERRRRETTLADLRRNRVAEAMKIRDELYKWTGIAIGLSPTDVVLDKYKEKELTQDIFKLVKRLKVSHKFCLVGEYSDKFRWHYHGILLVDDVDILMKIKRSLQRKYGRTVTEQIKNHTAYVNYLFKQYISTDSYYIWDTEKCYMSHSNR